MKDKPNTLVLFAQYTNQLSYYDDWLDAFRTHPGFRVETANVRSRADRSIIRRGIGRYDLIVLLHSTNADTLLYVEPLKETFSKRRGKLLCFVGNELNAPGSPISARIKFLNEIKADYIATQLLIETGQWLYAGVPSAKVIGVPHALNPLVFKPLVADADRPIDIGTRSARYIAYLGDNDRNRLFELFSERSFDPALRVDISTSERFSREAWCNFLNRCKGTVSNEAGGAFLERDDLTMTAIRAYVMEKERRRGGVVISNSSRLRGVGHMLPAPAKVFLRRFLRGGLLRHEMLINEELSFAEIYERFYSDWVPNTPVYGKCVSSRHFEAIGTETCQILMEGRYNDILIAGTHYLSLKSDFSNINAVIAEFRDPARRSEISRTARAFVLDCHTHRVRVDNIRALL